MAKRKFNFKFLILFTTVAVVTLLLAGVFYWYQIVLAPERNFKTGNDFMAAGNFEKAANYFGRAVSKKPTNLTYLNAYQGALLKIIPKSASEASENYNKLVNLRMSLTRASSKDAQIWIQAMETIRERA